MEDNKGKFAGHNQEGGQNSQGSWWQGLSLMCGLLSTGMQKMVHKTGDGPALGQRLAQSESYGL